MIMTIAPRWRGRRFEFTRLLGPVKPKGMSSGSSSFRPHGSRNWSKLARSWQNRQRNSPRGHAKLAERHSCLNAKFSRKCSFGANLRSRKSRPSNRVSYAAEPHRRKRRNHSARPRSKNLCEVRRYLVWRCRMLGISQRYGTCILSGGNPLPC